MTDADKKTDAWTDSEGQRKNWAVLDPLRPFTWPRVAGVYVIYFDERIIYIGQSSDVAARMLRHNLQYGYARNVRTPWGDVPDSVCITAKVKRSRVLGDWAMWELRLIQRLKPIGNRSMKRLKK